MEFETLLPAYGRDYTSRAQVLKDWVDGKDFQCAWSSRYCSSRDFQRHVTMRYQRSTKVTRLRYDEATETWQ